MSRFALILIMYRDGTGLFGYEDAIASRNILLPRKSLEFRR
jgi:hypothetical protein